MIFILFLINGMGRVWIRFYIKSRLFAISYSSVAKCNFISNTSERGFVGKCVPSETFEAFRRVFTSKRVSPRACKRSRLHEVLTLPSEKFSKK